MSNKKTASSTREDIQTPKKVFADRTISPVDEKAKTITGFADEEEEMDNESSVSTEEKELLERSENSMAGPDDEDAQKATLDNTDEDGDPLNEEVDSSGSDLDVPGSEDDDANEEIGEEDEENNSYSLGGDKDQ